MDKKQILEELLENNPQIPKDKLEEILNFFIENNPDIKIDENFRRNLKQKLKNIGNIYEKPKIWNYFLFGAPVISAICIFTFFVFYFKDFNTKDNKFYDYKLPPKNLELKSEDAIYLDTFKEKSSVKETKEPETKNIDTKKSIEIGEKIDKIDSEKNEQTKIEAENFILKEEQSQEIDEFIDENLSDYENIKPVKNQNYKLDYSFDTDFEAQDFDTTIKSDEEDDSSLKKNEKIIDSQKKDTKTFNLEKNYTPSKKEEIKENKNEKTLEKKDFESICSLNGFKIIKEDGITFCVNLEEKCSENDFKKYSCSFLK